MNASRQIGSPPPISDFLASLVRLNNLSAMYERGDCLLWYKGWQHFGVPGHARFLTFSAILIHMILLLGGVARAESKASADTLGELEQIAKVYRIEIVTADPRFPVKNMHGKIDGKNADRKALESYTGLFAPEFRLYPPGLVKRAQLKRVVFCQELRFAGQRRNAIPDFGNDTLYLDVTRGTYSKSYLRKVIHHEFFHMIDFRGGGTVFQGGGSVYRDKRWEALNPENFKYGSGGKNVQDLRETSVLTDKFPGFLNHYSTTAVEEDKAEVFANLIVEPAYVEGRTRKDPVLKAKVERMTDFLAGFCPDVKGQFWEQVRRMKRTDE